MYESFLCTQGSSLSFIGTLKDSQGNAVVNTYVGVEILETSVWPGGPRPTLFTPATTWVSAPAGTFQVEITDEQTALLFSGVYEGVTRLADVAARPDAYYFTLTVAPGPGGIPAAFTATTITRLVVEMQLIEQASALLLLCGKSVLADGGNRHLTGVIGFALTCLGFTPAVVGVVSDADLANVPPSQFFLLCELAEYKLLKSLLNNFAQPDRSAGSTKTSLNALIERFRQQMLDLGKDHAAYLGRNRSVLTTGSIRVRQPSSGNEF